jgi:hypothetical protein
MATSGSVVLDEDVEEDYEPSEEGVKEIDKIFNVHVADLKVSRGR